MKHYVYRHIRLDSNTPFYIGKGGYKQRAYDRTSRNYYWLNIVNKHGYKIEILKRFKTNKAAYRFEQKLIKLYKSLGYCEANFSDGGAGRTGFKQPEYIKKIISRKNSGKNNGMFGAYGSKNPSYGSGTRVKCLNNGKIYISCEAAQRDLKIPNVIKVACGLREHTKGYYFIPIDKELKMQANKLRIKRYKSSKRARFITKYELQTVYKLQVEI